jgi:UDP-GlcNAc:undecaprenyl-phosphate/decaprenyl-phosphate GlcNAc-1-phosphate transferase
VNAGRFASAAISLEVSLKPKTFMTHGLITFTAAVVAGLIAVPIVGSVATRWNVVDRPDASRKLHSRATPLGGGIAVLFAALVGLLTIGLLEGKALLDAPWLNPLQSIGFAIAALAIVALGLLDDVVTLRGRQKLLGQIAIAMILVSTGTVMRRLDVFGMAVELGPLAIPFTVLWLLGAINALNLIDGADGVASTVGAVICAGLSANAFMLGHHLDAWISLSMTAALTAFLVYNKPPAKIFLGDAGSMLIGLVVGVVAIWSSLKEQAVASLSVPFALLAIPLFDSAVAILRRWLTGRSIYTTDRGHLHHILLQRGLSKGQMVIVIGLLTAMTTAASVLSVYLSSNWIAVVGTLVILGFLIALRVFGHGEAHLLYVRAKHFIRSLFSSSVSCQSVVRHQSVSLQGDRQWHVVWDQMKAFAEDNQLAAITLDISAAWLHEGFHGVWKRDRLPERAAQWQFRIPVIIGGAQAGRFEVIGRADAADCRETIQLLLEQLEVLQENLKAVALSTAIPKSDAADNPKISSADIASVDAAAVDAAAVATTELESDVVAFSSVPR